MSKSKLAVVLFCLSIITYLPAQTKYSVTANSNNTFSPDMLTIGVGDTVVWTNAGGTHNVNGTTSAYPENPEGFGNGNASSSAWTFQHVFTIPGSYRYHCDLHLVVGMTGTIVVNAPAPGIVISEIMYNPPGADSDLEYLELYNAGDQAVNLKDYSFTGITATFPGYNLGAGEYVIVAADSAFFEAAFGIPAFQWDAGGLSNGGELLQLLDADGTVVDAVEYAPDGDWPPAANGLGASLVLCDPDADNSDPVNWAAATTATGILISGFELFANPAAAGQCATGPIVGFLDTELLVGEDAGTISVRVVLSDGAANTTTTAEVQVAASSSATAGSDYVFSTGSVSFTPGAANDTVTLNLDIIDDMELEALDTIVLELVNLSAEASVDVFSGTALIIIQDNDAVIPDLAITEIMYNPPESGTDSLEFIEIYNKGDEAADLTGYTFSAGITFTFPDFSLAAGEYVVIAINADAVANVFGVTALDADGALSNGGEQLQLINPGGTVVLDVTYDDGGDWPIEPDGNGPSLVLCDPDADPNDGANWQASTTDAGVVINGQAVLASPGAADNCTPPVAIEYPSYGIDVVNTVDANGVADSIGVRAEIQGVVYGVNLRPGGLQFTLIDAAGNGIGVFSNSEDFGYSVQEGDELTIRGTIGQFNGLTQIGVDTLDLQSIGNTLLEPRVVTELSEATESNLVRLENVTLVDPSEWDESGGSFNVSVTDGANTYLVRIDDNVDIAGTAAPDGPFNITGIGGQFDSSEPYTEGYQLLPRYQADIELISQVVDPALARSIRVYPNPARTFLQLQLDLPFDAVRIFHATGREMQLIYDPQADLRLEIGEWPSGLYTLTFIQGSRIWTVPVVKQ